jgi:hypothetical protein
MLAAVGGNGALPNLAASLRDTRMPAVQRQIAASQIGQAAGNQYLTGLLSRLDRDATVQDSGSGSSPVDRYQPPAISAQPNPGFIARDDTDTDTPSQPHVPFPPFGNLTNYAQLAAAAQFTIGQITADLRDVPTGHSVHQRATEFVDGLGGWLPIIREQGEAPLTQAAANQAQLHVEEAVAIREAIAQVRRSAAQRAMDRVAARARTAAESAAQLQPHMRDCMRAAYRSGDTSVIGNTASTLGGVVDIGLGLRQLARDAAQTVASLQQTQLPAVSQYVTALERLNRGLAAFNLAFTMRQTEATTQVEEAMRRMNVAVGAFGSLATLASLPPHIGLYVNLYLAPMTQAIMTGLSRLATSLQEQNDIWVGVFGEPLRYDVEPGGQPMWQFMTSVMRARSVADTPAISDEVGAYLLEHRAALEAGVREEVPTEGWWFWRSLNTERARRWIFDNRDNIWAMFYGSRRAPN